jgi:hypothetical protein
MAVVERWETDGGWWCDGVAPPAALTTGGEWMMGGAGGWSRR